LPKSQPRKGCFFCRQEKVALLSPRIGEREGTAAILFLSSPEKGERKPSRLTDCRGDTIPFLRKEIGGEHGGLYLPKGRKTGKRIIFFLKKKGETGDDLRWG